MKIKTLLLALLLFTQTSCITQALWGEKSYEEKINQFYIGSDGRYVVMIGNKYHYIFSDNSGTLKTILSLRQRGVLTIRSNESHLKLSSNNDLSGELIMSGPANLLPPEDVQTLEKMGVRPNGRGDISIFLTLTGRRYAAKYLNQAANKSETSYTITVYYRDSNVIKNAGKIAVTPIAVGLDTVLWIGKVTISVFD